ncbi:MAG: alkaline phosphatase D family protein, partial [Bacteroidota bacterium]
MKTLLLPLILCCLATGLLAQNRPFNPTSAPAAAQAHLYHPQRAGSFIDNTAFDPELRPFYHGVASGDPWQNGVVVWTRVQPESPADSLIEGTWLVATDTLLQQVVQNGSFQTDGGRDFTVKIEVENLSPGTHYYYVFEVEGRKSLIGRTKTASSGPIDRLQFAVVSCNNYEAGYYNAFARIAERNDLEAVIHLGDYIYEYASGVFGDSTVERQHDSTETVSLAEYRARYSLYRLDPDLRRVHQQHPFISIWDDHETANDAWTDGAQNHDPATEGDWNLRKSVGKQAFYEWLPIRDRSDTTLYRVLPYGDMADLLMLDTRLEGREQQVQSVTDPALYDSARTLLGPVQRDWFLDELQQSTARWKLVGNQVMFSLFHIGWASAVATDFTPEELESLFLDIWDGYPAERQRIIQYLDSAQIDNVAFLTGDIHSSFGLDVAAKVNEPDSGYIPVPDYDPMTGNGSVAVEFVTPSITSANFDELLGALPTALLETFFNTPQNPPLPEHAPNPHMKYVDLDRHGYVLINVFADSLQGDWYYANQIAQPASGQSFGGGRYTRWGENFLRTAQAAIPPKPVQADPAPL